MKTEDQILIEYCLKKNYRIVDKDAIILTVGYAKYLLQVRISEVKEFFRNLYKNKKKKD